jgi:hypothetical protein
MVTGPSTYLGSIAGQPDASDISAIAGGFHEQRIHAGRDGVKLNRNGLTIVI